MFRREVLGGRVGGTCIVQREFKGKRGFSFLKGCEVRLCFVVQQGFGVGLVWVSVIQVFYQDVVVMWFCLFVQLICCMRYQGQFFGCWQLVIVGGVFRQSGLRCFFIFGVSVFSQLGIQWEGRKGFFWGICGLFYLCSIV